MDANYHLLLPIIVISRQHFRAHRASDVDDDIVSMLLLNLTAFPPRRWSWDTSCVKIRTERIVYEFV